MEHFKPFLLHYGYWAVFAAIMLEDFGLPVPGEALLIAGSVLASQGGMHIVPLLILAWAGAVLGDNIGYGIGRFAGRHLILQYGRYVFVTRNRLEHAEKFFRKYGGLVVVFARFIEILRQLNGIIAGLAQMRWSRFLPYNAIGAALWVAFWGILSYKMGSQAAGFLNHFNRVEIFVIIAVGIAIVGVAIYLIHHRRKQ